MKQSTQKKLIKLLIIFIIPVILIATGFLFYGLINNEIEGFVRMIFVSIMVGLMLALCCILIIGITKYKDEFLLNDIEKQRKWKILSLGYKKFHNCLGIFSLILFPVIILFGLSEILIYKNWNGLNSVILGTLFGLIRLKTKFKEKNL